jgi:predicted N-acyltransferase
MELTQKRSVTLTGSLISEVEALAGPRGFSAATAEALAHWVARTRLRRAIESYEAAEGEITQTEMDAVVARMGGL